MTDIPQWAAQMACDLANEEYGLVAYHPNYVETNSALRALARLIAKTMPPPYALWTGRSEMREPFALVVKKRGGGERTIEPNKFWINRNTPRGEDAEIWERMPHQGRREILWSEVIRKEPRTVDGGG